MFRFVVCLCFLVVLFANGCGDDESDSSGGLSASGMPLVFSAEGEVSFDKGSYYATNAADVTAFIKVLDTDLSNTNLVAVQVSSGSDPVGITLQLSNYGGVFRAPLLFSYSNSVAGTTLKVAAGDILFVRYIDQNPAAVRSAVAYWWESEYYGIYNETYVQNEMQFDIPDADPDAGFIVFANMGAHGFSESTNFCRDGAKGIYSYLRNDALLLQFANPRNLSTYQNGTLNFSIQATNDLALKLEWVGGSAYVNIGDYATLDGSWQDVSVPLSDFAGLDMSCIDIVFGLHWWDSRVVAHFYLDKVYLEN